MKHTDNQITAITTKVLDDINFEYYKERKFEIKRTNSKGLLGRNSNIEKGVLVFIYWFDPDYLGGNDVIACLTVDDETGEPEELGARFGGGGNWVIKKNNKNRYFVESRY